MNNPRSANNRLFYRLPGAPVQDVSDSKPRRWLLVLRNALLCIAFGVMLAWLVCPEAFR